MNKVLIRNGTRLVDSDQKHEGWKSNSILPRVLVEYWCSSTGVALWSGTDTGGVVGLLVLLGHFYSTTTTPLIRFRLRHLSVAPDKVIYRMYF